MYKEVTIDIKRKDYNIINTWEKGFHAEIVSRSIYKNHYLKDKELLRWNYCDFNNNLAKEQQQYGDFIILNEDILRSIYAFNNDYYFMESKACKVTSGEAKLFMDMYAYKGYTREYEPLREPYRQGNTGTNIGWAMHNSQPRILTAYCIEKQTLYIIKRWQALSLEVKRLYQDTPYNRLQLPFDRQLNVPDRDNHGEIYKYTDCVILHLEKMSDNFMERYGIDVVKVNYKIQG